MEYPYEIEMKVRDYECDIQGIVNNSVYQNYLEHARHEYLRSNGVSFAEMHNRGVDAVVARIEMAFKTPLRPGDDFIVKINASLCFRLFFSNVLQLFNPYVSYLQEYTCCFFWHVN